MKRLNLLYLLLIIIPVLIFVSVLIVDVFGVRNRADVIKRGTKFEVVDDGISGVLKPEHDGINIVVVQLKNPGLESTNDYVFEVNADNQTIRSIVFNGANAGDPSDVRLQFEPIADSSKKLFEIKVKPLDEKDRILQARVDETGNLSYLSYYRVVEKSDAVESILFNLKQKILSNLVFFGLWLTILYILYSKGYNLE